MRLGPIERPPSRLMRLAYRLARRELGRVPSVFRVLYARVPRVALLGGHLAHTLERGLSLDAELRHLILGKTSQLNHCGFCADLHAAQLLRQRIGLARFEALADSRTSEAFDARERAALAYVEEVTREHRASDACFAELQKHFEEREVAEIVWLTAVGNYFNLIAVPLGLESDGLAELARAARSVG